MATKNDITGDSIRSRHSSQAYSDGWDRIFGKTKKVDKNGSKEKNGILNSPSENGSSRRDSRQTRKV